MTWTKEAHAEYNRQRRKAAHQLYFENRDALLNYQGMARASGYASFNKWLLQMIMNATSGSLYPPDYVESLKAEADRMRRWLENTREEAEDLRAQVKTLQSQRDSLIVLMHGLPTGPEAAARFLTRANKEGRQ